jgi:hypothetical protein
MTYVFDHVQYVAVTAGNSVLAFALPEAEINAIHPHRGSAGTIH